MIFNLTRKQRELLTFINAFTQDNGIAPSYQQMMEHLGLRSKSGVHRLVLALEERRLIQRLPNRARSIIGNESATFTLHLPFELEYRVRRIAEQCDTTPEQLIMSVLREMVAPKAA